jgi:acyl-CoA thioesterase YciA
MHPFVAANLRPTRTGKKILLGISGSITAFKAHDLVRFLKDCGAQVRCVLTDSAKEFVTPLTLETLNRESTMTEPYIALQVVMMPQDANPSLGMLASPGGGYSLVYNTIFGGVLLSFIDQAGAIGARREVMKAGGPPPFLVTVAMDRIEFKQPVFVGDVVRFTSRLLRIGRTSARVHVSVEVERNAQIVPVTEAEVTYVGVEPSNPNNKERRPIPLLPEATYRRFPIRSAEEAADRA